MDNNHAPVAPQYEAIGCTTYAPPVRVGDLPLNSVEWRRRAGLTDPAVIAARAHLRSGGAPMSDPAYADFFRS